MLFGLEKKVKKDLIKFDINPIMRAQDLPIYTSTPILSLHQQMMFKIILIDA